MLFIEIPRAMAGKVVVFSCGNHMSPAKGSQKANKCSSIGLIEKEVFVAGKDERGRISGIPTAWRMVVVRFEPFGLKMRRG